MPCPYNDNDNDNAAAAFVVKKFRSKNDNLKKKCTFASKLIKK
jgi:hypothetical protein